MFPRAVVYVNFSQYDNTGRILDYLREQFPAVLHFSFDHLRLKNGRKTNLITLYKKGHAPQVNTLYSLRLPKVLLFPSLPLVGVLMVFQTIRHSIRISKQYSETIFFTVNAFPALIGIFLRLIGTVNRVHYWVWDYFPVRGPDWTLKVIRYCYLLFDMLSLRFSDVLVFPNEKQKQLRATLHGVVGDFPIVPLGSSKPVSYHNKKFKTLGFLGMLKGSQGIDLVLSSFEALLKDQPDLHLEIIGSGPEEELLRKKAEHIKKNVTFYGFIDNQNRINAIVKKWFAGLALYEPVAGNESYFGDPSKIKVYISQGVPIITTNVTEYGEKAKQFGFGICVPFQKPRVVTAMKTLRRRQVSYRKNALLYAQKLYYRRLYSKLFHS